MPIQNSLETAHDHMNDKKYTLAVLHLETAIQSPGFQTSAWKHLIYHSLGICFLELKAFDDAISALNSCVALAPTPTETTDYVLLADTHQFLSRAYEEKSAVGRHLLPLVGGHLACH